MLRGCLISLVLAACIEPPASPSVVSHVFTFDVPGFDTRGRDVLIVVDDSTRMANSRDHLLASSSRISDVLDGGAGSRTSLHLGTVGSSSDGALKPVPGVAGTFLSNVFEPGDYDRTANFYGPMSAIVARMLDVGTTSTAPTLFETARHALAQNEGFLRPDATVVVVFVSAGDDTSAASVDEYVQALESLKPDRERVEVVGIYPRPAPRLDALLTAFPYRSSYGSIDDQDLGAPFDLVNLVWSDLGLTCFPASIDRRIPDTADACAVSLVKQVDGVEKTRPFPRCGLGIGEPCWQLVAHPACADGDLALTVLPPSEFRPSLRGECLLDGE